MNSVNEILFYTSGILFWTAVVFGITVILNLIGHKERTVLTVSLLVIVVVGLFHVIQKSKLNTYLENATCRQIKIPDKLECITYHSWKTVYMTTNEKDQPLRLEKFYRENEYLINRQVLFEVKETCSLVAFCKYDYDKMFQEFEGRKDRIETFLTDDLHKRIYFE